MGRELALITLLAGCAAAGVDEPAQLPDAAPVVLDGRIEGTPGVPCATTEVCTTTATMGTVSGDKGADMLLTTGHLSAWLRLRVTENESGAGGKKLRVSAKLTSPVGVLFDVFAYVNTSSDMIECATQVGTLTTTGNVQEVRLEWGEGGLANGADDSRDVSVEIRPVGATCATDRTWSLELAGNWQ
jgi:hypothetical protein